MRRWTRTRTVLVVVGVLAVLGALVWVVAGSSLLTVRTVAVHGVSGSLAEQVRAKATDQVGTPLARVDLDDVTTSVEQVVGVSDVHVTRSWPHTLRVEVVPRKAAAFTSTGEGEYEVLDKTGVVLRTTSSRPGSLPRVHVGSGVGAQLADGLEVLAAVPPKVRPRVDEVDVRSAQDVRLTLGNGDVVKWGSAENSARKALVLTALLKQRASVYDVSAPELPTTRK